VCGERERLRASEESDRLQSSHHTSQPTDGRWWGVYRRKVYPPAHTQNFNSPRSLCARTHIHTACRRIHPYRSPPPTHPHFNNESQSTQKPDHHMDTTDGFNRAGGQGCNGVGIRVNEATAGLMTASPSAPDTHGPQRRVMSRVCESPCVCVTRVSCTMQV
jgi:hypothetical protein